LLCPGALIVDFGPFLPSWYSWRPNSKDPTILSKSFMASAEIDQEFIDRLGAPFMLAAERAASFFIATKSPTLRSVSDVAMMVQYLRHVPMLSRMSSETLEAVAFALELRDVQQNEVLTSHGEKPTDMLLPLSSVVSAWRRMPEGKVASAHARLSEEAIQRARGVLQGYESPPKRLSVSPRKSQSRGREFWICVDVTDKDDVVPHSEWAMAASCPCNVSLVAIRRGKAFSLSKADYQRHVQHHRVGIVLEVMAFLGRVLTPPDVLSQDLWWLEETPLARSPIMRALPRDVRQRILCSGALRKLPSRSWLCREEDTLHACYLLISGELELSLPGTERRRLLPGVVFGDKMLCTDSPEPGWASRYCAGGEDCLLYEVSRQSFEAGLQLSEVTDPRVPEIEKALQIPFGARTFTQLQLLSSFLERQVQFSTVDSFARLEISEFAELRKMSAGEAIPFSLQCSCCILHGKVSVLVREGDQQVHVCSLSAGSWLGEEFGMSGEFCILAARDCSLFWLDRSHLPQGRGSIIAIGGDKATDRASTDRGRAIQTLRFKAPEQRSPEDVALLAKLFHGNKFFDEQEESVLREICRSMSYEEVKRHQVIIKQGDVADMCYILLKGAVGIWVSRQDELIEEEEAKEEPESPARTKDDEQDASPKTTKSMPQAAEKETEVQPSSVHARKLQKAAVKLLVARRAVDDPAPQGKQPAAESQDPNSEVDPETGGPINATQVKELKEGDCFGEDSDPLPATVARSPLPHQPLVPLAATPSLEAAVVAPPFRIPPARLFVDLCAGADAPVSAALAGLQKLCFRPVDLLSGEKIDFLDDDTFAFLQRLLCLWLGGCYRCSPSLCSVLSVPSPSRPPHVHTLSHPCGRPDYCPLRSPMSLRGRPSFMSVAVNCWFWCPRDMASWPHLVGGPVFYGLTRRPLRRFALGHWGFTRPSPDAAVPTGLFLAATLLVVLTLLR
ncbi:unnamed protein product, partial [Symbiodinium microadriaticum]